jgi:hypothetical protein
MLAQDMAVESALLGIVKIKVRLMIRGALQQNAWAGLGRRPD